jgi:hypothetical protein
MRFAAQPVRFALIAVALVAAIPASAQNKKFALIPEKLLSAKTLYFENQTGNSAVGDRALAELQKWARFQLVDDPKSADIAIVLSATRYSSDMNIFGKQIGTDANSTPPEFAYLTVLDPVTKANLWTDSCNWGGVLTGRNSAGARLVKKLKQQLPSAAPQKTAP